ncbi:MAG: Cyclohexadienyl dehydrogenase [Phycisphaerae bacterium]|nr:Cyclohexadienyl dehydrogenase [Phycisphaerae bacterium]
MKKLPPIDAVAILGVGLLGGSIGLALRRAGFAGSIVGVGRRQESIDAALEAGAVDRGLLDPADGVAGAGLVVLATPIGAFPRLMTAIAPALGRRTLVTDVGSTKRQVVRWAARLLPDPSRFVGAHPIAGSDQRGPQYARADLFDAACCVLTPSPPRAASGSSRVRGSDYARSVETIDRFWRSLGLWTTRMTPAAHDRALAEVSHLPHAVAAALMRITSAATQDVSGPGFVDVTRIAGGDPELWRDIFSTNRDAVLAAVKKLGRELERFAALLESADPEPLRRWLAAAQKARHAMIDRKYKRDFFEG